MRLEKHLPVYTTRCSCEVVETLTGSTRCSRGGGETHPQMGSLLRETRCSQDTASLTTQYILTVERILDAFARSEFIVEG